MQQGFIGTNLHPNRFSRDLTDADLSSHLQSVRSSGGVHVNFFYTKVRAKTRDASRNGQVSTRLCISKQPKGDRSTVSVRFISEERAKRDHPREFDLFKKYEEVPTEGTPLSDLPGISVSQIGLLTINGLRSVEDLCEVSEDQVAQLGLDVIRAKKTATAWMAKRDSESETISAADIEARYSLQLDAMSKQFKAMEEHNRQLQAQVSALQSVRSTAAPESAGQTQVGVAGVDVDGDLEYDMAAMPDPFSEGPATTDGDDDLGATDPDPLANG